MNVGEFVKTSYTYIDNLLKTVQCPICLDTLKGPIISKCGHKFCKECFHKAMKRRGEIPCPICKNAIRKRDMKHSDHFNLILLTIREVVAAFQKEKEAYQAQQCYDADTSADFGQEKTPLIKLHSDGAKNTNLKVVDEKVFGIPKRPMKKYGILNKNTAPATSIVNKARTNTGTKRKRGKPKMTTDNATIPQKPSLNGPVRTTPSKKAKKLAIVHTVDSPVNISSPKNGLMRKKNHENVTAVHPSLTSWIEADKTKNGSDATSLHVEDCNQLDMLSDVFSDAETCPKKLFFSSPSGENKLKITAVNDKDAHERLDFQNNENEININNFEDDFIPSSWPGAMPGHTLCDPVVLLKKLSSKDIKTIQNLEKSSKQEEKFSPPIIQPCTPIATTDDEEQLMKMEKSKMSFADPLIRTLTSSPVVLTNQKTGLMVDFSQSTTEMKLNNKKHTALQSRTFSRPVPSQIPETNPSQVPPSFESIDTGKGLFDHFKEIRDSPLSPSVADESSSAEETFCEEQSVKEPLSSLQNTCIVLTEQDGTKAASAVHWKLVNNSDNISQKSKSEILKTLKKIESKNKELQSQIENLKQELELKSSNAEIEQDKFKQEQEEKYKIQFRKFQEQLTHENDEKFKNFQSVINQNIEGNVKLIENERDKWIQENEEKFLKFSSELDKLKSFRELAESKFMEISLAVAAGKERVANDDAIIGEELQHDTPNQMQSNNDNELTKDDAMEIESVYVEEEGKTTTTVLQIGETEKSDDNSIVPDIALSKPITIPDSQDDAIIKATLNDEHNTSDKEKTPDEKEMELLNAENADTNFEYEENEDDNIESSPLLFEKTVPNIEQETVEEVITEDDVSQETVIEINDTFDENKIEEEAVIDHEQEVLATEHDDDKASSVVVLNEVEEEEFFPARDELSPVEVVVETSNDSNTQKITLSNNCDVDVVNETPQPPTTENKYASAKPPEDVPQVGPDDSISMCGTQNLVLLTSGLLKQDIAAVHMLAKKLNATVSSHFDEATVTHVIVKTDADMRCERTLKYLQGVAGRKWVVSFNWVIRCLKLRCKVSEIEFEVRGDNSTDDCSLDLPPPLSALQSRIRPDRDGLFTNYKVLVLPPIARMTVEQLMELLQLCGATVVDSLNELVANSDCEQQLQSVIVVDGDAEVTQAPDYASLTKKYNCHVLNLDWVIESIGSYTLQSMESHDMLMDDFSEFISPHQQ